MRKNDVALGGSRTTLAFCDSDELHPDMRSIATRKVSSLCHSLLDLVVRGIVMNLFSHLFSISS